MPKTYSDLSQVPAVPDLFSSRDPLLREVLADPYGKVIFAGYRSNFIVTKKGLTELKKESLRIAHEIREKKLPLEHAPVKKRLTELYRKVFTSNTGLFLPDCACGDISDGFVTSVLPFLTGEKSFGYTVQDEKI